MDTLFHILGWILLLTPLVVVVAVVIMALGWTGVLVMGGMAAAIGFLMLALWLIFY